MLKTSDNLIHFYSPFLIKTSGNSLSCIIIGLLFRHLVYCVHCQSVGQCNGCVDSNSMNNLLHTKNDSGGDGMSVYMTRYILF